MKQVVRIVFIAVLALSSKDRHRVTLF